MLSKSSRTHHLIYLFIIEFGIEFFIHDLPLFITFLFCNKAEDVLTHANQGQSRSV